MSGVLKHDIYSGIIKNWGKLFFGVVIFIIAGMTGLILARNYGISNVSWSELSSYIFAGAMPYQETSEKGYSFHIPLVWLIIQIYMAYMISVYPLHDLKTYGVNMLLKIKNRGKWWTGKAVWAILLNVIIYALGNLVIFITTLLSGGIKTGMFTVREEITQNVTYVNMSGLSSGQIILVLVVFPLITSIAMSLLQLMVIICFSEVVSYGVVLFMCVAGAFYEIPVLFIEYSMCIRTTGYLLQKKTMLMRAMGGLIRPTQGSIVINGEVLGKDMSFPKSIGVLIENPAFIDSFSGFRNLKALADINKIITDEDIRKTIEMVGLNPDDKKKYKKYSLGMKQRLGIAAAIMEKSEIMLLDEPINALDESGVEEVRKILLSLKSNDRVIIIACHDREELELLSDEIIEMENGACKQ